MFRTEINSQTGEIKEIPLTTEELMEIDSKVLPFLKEEKKQAIETLRNDRFADPFFVKNIDSKPYYIKTDPKINIFQSAILMEEGATRIWGCYCEGKKVLLELTKAELLSLARHYEERKNQEYNLCDKRRAAIDLLTTIKEVNAFDITQIIE